MGGYIDIHGNEWGHCEVCKSLVRIGKVLCVDHSNICLPDCTCDGCLLDRARKQINED